MGIVLALGGGGIRGVAHLGFLQVLQQAGVPIVGIAGSSAGALVGASYAFGLPLSPEPFLQVLRDPELEKLSKSGAFRQMVRILATFVRPSLADAKFIEQGLEKLFGERRLEESPIPLALVAADLHTGELVALHHGKVATALRASTCVPSVFPPVAWEGRMLVDGDVVEKVPVSVARSLAMAPVVAFDISNLLSKSDPRTALEVALLAGEASRKRLLDLALAQADLVVRLSPAKAIETFDFSKVDEVYALGMQRAQESLPDILALLPKPQAKKRHWFDWFTGTRPNHVSATPKP